MNGATTRTPSKETPKISLVSTNYNNGPFLHEMVDSVLNQSVDYWELIIVDDGSTDSSRELLVEISNLDKRINILLLEKNEGAAQAFNHGINLAKSKLIGRLDPDDALECQAIEIMVTAHENHPEQSLICSHTWECSEDLTKIRLWPGYRAPINGVPLIKECTIGAFATFKKIAFESTKGLDPMVRRAVDLDLYLKLEETGPFLFINEPLYLYRQHANGISQGDAGGRAYQWARYVRLSAHFRRKKNNNTSTLQRQEVCTLAYSWFVQELIFRELKLPRLKVLLKTFRFCPLLLFYPKTYLHLIFTHSRRIP